MGLVVAIALGIVAAALILNFLPEILTIGLAVGALLIIGGLLLLYLGSTNGGKTIPSTVALPVEKPSSAYASNGLGDRAEQEFFSLSDRIRTGPDIDFRKGTARGQVIAALDMPQGVTRILVSLTSTTGARLVGWTAQKVAGEIRSQFCGPTGLLSRFTINQAKTEVTIAANDKPGSKALPARLCTTQEP